jgi:hypothetical protein
VNIRKPTLAPIKTYDVCTTWGWGARKGLPWS